MCILTGVFKMCYTSTVSKHMGGSVCYETIKGAGIENSQADIKCKPFTLL